MKTLMLLAVVAVGALTCCAFEPMSRAVSATVMVMPAVKSHLASLMEIPVDTTPRGILIIVR